MYMFIQNNSNLMDFLRDKSKLSYGFINNFSLENNVLVTVCNKYYTLYVFIYMYYTSYVAYIRPFFFKWNILFTSFEKIIWHNSDK